jgi:ribosome-binding protein aMBF1 (putative translation factor)
MKLGPHPALAWPVFASLAMPRQVHCEICGRAQHQVQHMVAGPPGINVCSDCVIEIAELIARESPQWGDEAIDRLKRAKNSGP